MDSNLQVSSTGDGVYDCQPIVYPQCASTEVRLFDGSCATDSYCNKFCGSQGGSLSPTIGTCICNNITTLAEVCDQDCRDQSISVKCDGDGYLLFSYSDGTSQRVAISSLPTQGGLDCSSDSSIYSMTTTQGKFTGVFGINSALLDVSQAGRRMLSLPNGTVTLTNRILTTGQSAQLSNPIVTIYVGDSVVFDVSKTSYPVYVKDSLLNTNPNFDYSAFRNLQSTAQTTISFTTFSFTFSEAGTYVFSLSSNSASITLINVLASTIKQQTAAQFVEFSESNLIVSGVKSSDNIVLSPDWNLVIGLLLGMLAIVLLVVGFLYYFRKKSWSYHTNIEALYRKNNKSTNFEGKGPKGGLFSGQKTNKIFADNTSPADGVLPKDDLESPAFPGEDENPDDDGLLPELAKHLQSHHDEIDRQLLNQNDILNALQETLKKEVDDLKHLLQSTAMEISLNANSEQRNKKLQTMLMQLRADALARDSFENMTDTTQRRIVASFGQLREALMDGPDQIANAIVQDLSQQAVNLSNLDEQVAGMNSPILQQLGEYLGQISYFTNNDLWLAIDEEKRRRKAADDSFEQSLKNLQSIVFPAEVLDCLKTSKDVDIISDLAMDNSTSVLKSFCDHIPQFVNFMTESQSSLNRGLARTVEKGNMSMVEREQELGRQNFTGYLKDLLEAIDILENTYKDRLAALLDSEADGKSAREKLIEAIDAALAMLQNQPASSDHDAGNIQQLLEPLLAALREGKMADIAPAISPREVEPPAEVLTSIPEEEEEVGANVLDNVMNNENISILQKGNLLDSAENDLKLMDNILELERKRQEEVLQKALELNNAQLKPDEEESSSSAKFKEEQKLLEQKLKEEREKELAAIASQEVEDSKSVESLELSQKIRSTTAYRSWNLFCSAKYREFSVDRMVVKAKLLDQLFSKGGNVTNEALKSHLLRLTDEDKKELSGLHDSLQRMLATFLENGQDRSFDAKEINFAHELSLSEKEFDERALQAKSILKSAHEKLAKNVQLFKAAREHLKNRLLTDENKKILTLSFESITGDEPSLENHFSALAESDLVAAENEERDFKEVAKDLVFGLPGHAKQEKQRLDAFHLIALGSLQVHSTMENRLAFVEFENRNEIDRIKLWTDLYHRQLSLDEQRAAYQDFSKQKTQEQNQLQAQLQAQLAKVHQIEVDRQQTAENNFERERAFIVERLLAQEQQLRIQTIRSQILVESEMVEVLKQRQVVVQNKMKEQHTSPELISWMMKRLHSDACRARLEYQLSYDAFEEGSAMLSRYCLELVVAAEPGLGHLKQLTNFHHLNKLSLLLLISKVEDTTKRTRIQWNAEIYRDFEAKRMRELGRTAEDYQAMCNDIRMNCQEEIKALDVSTAAELWRIKNAQEATVEEKLSIHQSYGEEVAAILSKAHNNKFIARSSAEDPPVPSPEILSLLLQADTTSFHDLMDSFKSAISKLISNQKVEDELAGIRRTLKHESEEVEEMLHQNELNRLDELLHAQQARKSQLEEKKDALQEELAGKIVSLEQKKLEEVALVKELAGIRKEEREKQLELEGVPSSEARKVAEAEMQERIQADIAKIEKEYQQKLADLQKSLKGDLSHQLADAKQHGETVEQQVSQGVPVSNRSDVQQILDQARKNAEEEKKIARSEMELELLDLAKQISKEQEAGEKAIAEEMDRFEQERVVELVNEGLSEADAKAQAHSEREQLEQEKMAQLSSRLEEMLTAGQAELASKLENKIKDLDEQVALAMDLLTKGMKETLEAGMRTVKEALAAEMEQRRRELADSGVSEPEIQKILDAESAAKEKAAVEHLKLQVDAAKEQIAKENRELLEKKTHQIEADYQKNLRGYEESMKQKQDALKKHLAERLQQRAKKEAKQLQAAHPEMSQAEAEARAKAVLESAGLSAGVAEELAKQEQSDKEHLQAMQMALKQSENELKRGKNEQSLLDDQEAVQLRQELREKARQLVNNENASTASVMNAATEAAKAQQSQAEKEIGHIRDRYKADVQKLEEEFEAKLSKEKKNLQTRLQNRKKDRERELLKSGKSAPEAKKALENEEKHALTELEEKLLVEKDAKVQEKRKEALQAESTLIEKEHQKTLLEARNAEVNKQALQEKIDQIKLQHEGDSKHLQERLDSKKKQQEESLKQRLADRRNMKLKQTESDQERKKLEEELAQEEQQMLQDLMRQQLAEEEKERERQRQEQEAQLAKVLQDLQNAEVEAAIALAKEKTVNTIKSMQTQVEQDTNLREVQKLRAMHDANEEKRLTDLEQSKAAGKGKLEERLAAKRAKREKELKEKEEKALAELLAKQQAEAEEKERLRQAKMSWMEKVQEVLQRAKGMKVSTREKEDYCCKETLGKKGLVPEIQINEAVQMILKERHDQEMTALLTANFDERITALRQAVEKVIEEKSNAKIALVERLSEESASNEKISQELLRLDSDFNQKQLQAEKNATAALEEKHLRSQLDLKKQQLQEIAEQVSFYTDPEALKRLSQQSTSLSPEEQLQQYQQRLEAERKQREEQLLKERMESEEKLRHKLQEEMNKLEAEISQEQKKVEAEFEKKRQEMLKQKEELTKKQLNEKESLENAEKQRILSNFEKEAAAALESLNQDRLNKKARLTERLNRRRSTAVPQLPAGGLQNLPTQSPSEDLVKSSETVQQLGRQESQPKLAPKPKASAELAAVAIPPALTQSMQLIETKLERIEKVISALEKSGLPVTSSSAPAAVQLPAPTQAAQPTTASPHLPAYQDRDEPVPGERLEVVPDSDLAVQERARVDFGKRLATMIGLKSLNIQSATSLPPSGLTNNAFSNSYSYSAEENTLFVHHNRLGSSGDFGLVVIHALSHIKVNPADLSNDNDPRFMSEFYKNLKILSQDLYKKTAVAQTNPNFALSGGNNGRPAANKRQKSRSSFNMFGPGDGNNDLQQSMLLAAALAGDDGSVVGEPSRVPGSPLPSAGGAFFGEPASHAHSSVDYSHDSLVERMRMYAQQGGIPLDYIERYTANNNNGSSNGNNLNSLNSTANLNGNNPLTASTGKGVTFNG